MGLVRLLAQKNFNAISFQRDFELARSPAAEMSRFLATSFATPSVKLRADDNYCSYFLGKSLNAPVLHTQGGRFIIN